MENGLGKDFDIENRVLIFTTSIKTFIYIYIFKVTNHKNDCKNNQSQEFTYEDVNRIQRNRYRIHRRYVHENPKENVIKVANKW